MEIWNNLLNILTTENEMVTKIIAAPTVFIEVWIIFLLAISIFKINYDKRKKSTFIIVLSFCSLINEFLIPTPYNIILNYIAMFVLVKLLLKLNTIESIFCVIGPTVIYALLGILVLKPALLLFNIKVEEITNIPIYRLLYLISSYILAFILVKLLKYLNSKFSFKFSLKENFESTDKKILVINGIFGIFTISVQLIITAFYTETLPLGIIVLSFISLFAYFLISFYSLTRIIKLHKTAKELESAENYNTTLSYLYDNVKAFHHDFDNMLFIIGGFIDNNDINGLKKYYKSLEKDSEKVNNIALLNPKLINNSGIYNLLMSKYKKAEDSGVEIKLDFFFDFNKLQMPIYEFSRILGILLDNSIEAAKEPDKKQVKIQFRDSTKNRTQIIIIENTYINKEIDTKEIFKKGISSKENHSGMGLWEVNQILKRINNINLITSKNSEFFNQTLEIYY